MKFKRCSLFVFLALFSINGLTQQPSGTADEVRVSSLSAKLTGFFGKLGDGVTSVNMDWKENSEVKEILSFPSLKRVAAIKTVVDTLRANDLKVFPKSESDQNHLAAMVITRLLALNHIKELIGETPDDLGMKDYLDSEIGDLALVIAHKIPYDFYLKASKQREDKIAYLYFSNEEFIGALLKFRTEKTNSVIRLSNKTTAISLLENCTQNIELCEKL